MSAQFMGSQAIKGTNASSLSLANNKPHWRLIASEARKVLIGNLRLSERHADSS
jgi:hypothetical protein